MLPDDFLYVIKRVLESPFVIGILIFAFLFLQLLFYVLNYREKPKIKKNKMNNAKSKQKKEVVEGSNKE